MIYFIRRYGKMFKNYGPQEKPVIIFAADRMKIENGVAYKPINPKIFWPTERQKDDLSGWYAYGFMKDMYVGDERDLIKDIFLKEKGRS